MKNILVTKPVAIIYGISLALSLSACANQESSSNGKIFAPIQNNDPAKAPSVSADEMRHNRDDGKYDCVL